MAQKVFIVVSNYSHSSNNSLIISTFSKLNNAVEEFNWCCKCIESDDTLNAEKNVICDDEKYKFVVYYVPNTKTYMTVQLNTSYIFDALD